MIPFDDGHTRQLPVLTAGPFRYTTYSGTYVTAAKAHTGRRIKQAVIAPSAISLIYPQDGIEGYCRDAFLADLVNECEKDIRSAFDPGADSVQIDFTEGRLCCKLNPSRGLLRDFVALNNQVLARFSDAEKAEIERLRTRHDELASLDEHEWAEELAEEAEAIDTRLDAIEAEVDGRARFRTEDFRIAGCIATIGRDGTLQVIQGLVKPEDMPKKTGAADNSHDADPSDDGATDSGRIDGPAISAPIASPPDPRAKAREEAGVGIGLADDLRAIRTALVKAYLANDFEAAFDLVVFQMVRAVFARGYTASWHALDIAFNETADRGPPCGRTTTTSRAGARARRCSPTGRTCRSSGWRPVRGFKTMKTAYATIKGFEVMRALRKGQAEMFTLQGGIVGEARIVERAFGVGPWFLTEAMAWLQDRLASAET